MVLAGIADTGPKVIKELELSNISMSYLNYNYLFALIPTLSICIKRKSYPRKKEWIIGLVMGISLLFSMFFLVLTLRIIPGTVVYPLNKTIVDVVIVLLSFFIWKEKLNIKQIFGVCTAIIAALLLNLSL